MKITLIYFPRDYDDFLNDIEEDKDFRQNINIYKGDCFSIDSMIAFKSNSVTMLSFNRSFIANLTLASKSKQAIRAGL